MKIIAEPPRPVTKLRKSVPPNVAAAVAKALEKLPADRFESAKAFADALANPVFASRAGTSMMFAARAVPRTWNRVTVAMTGLAAVLAIMLGASTASRRSNPEEQASVVRFTLTSDPSLLINSNSTRPFAVSPDGRTIVFRALTDSIAPHLWVRSIGDPVARRLEGTLDAMNPAISPDGRTVAFLVQNRQLNTVPIEGGPVRQVATLRSICAALSWASNDDILLEAISPAEGIQRVSAQGGTPQIVVPLDTAGGESLQRRPFMLGDAGIIVYGSNRSDRELTEINLHRFADGHRVRLRIDGIGGLAFIDDHLIYSGALGELRAVRLNTRTMEIEGAPVELSPRVSAGGTGTAVALSENGTLVYRSVDATSDARLELVDTSGRITRTLPGGFGVIGTPRFSPDGKRIVMGLGTNGVFGRRMGVVFSDLWVVDITSGEPTRLTSGVSAIMPTWLADGQRVQYIAERNGGTELWSVSIGGGAPSLLLDLRSQIRLSAATPDGTAAVVSIGTAAGGSLLRAWLDGSGRVDTLVTRQAQGIRAVDPRVSPDGKWVAFLERSSNDVWVRSLTGSGLMQVSLRGTEGNPVAWAPDSRRIYYANTDGLNVVELETTPSLGILRRRIVGRFPPVTDYDLSPDGRTFVVVTPIRSTSDVIVAVNWLDEARRTWSGSLDRMNQVDR